MKNSKTLEHFSISTNIAVVTGASGVSGVVDWRRIFVAKIRARFEIVIWFFVEFDATKPRSSIMHSKRTRWAGGRRKRRRRVVFMRLEWVRSICYVN